MLFLATSDTMERKITTETKPVKFRYVLAIFRTHLPVTIQYFHKQKISIYFAVQTDYFPLSL